MADKKVKEIALAILSGKRVKPVELDLLASYALVRELEPGKLLPTLDAALAERSRRSTAAFDRKLDRIGKRG